MEEEVKLESTGPHGVLVVGTLRRLGHLPILDGLGGAGRLHRAQTPSEALHFLSRQRPSLLLVEDVDGEGHALELCRTVRTRYPRTPCVLLGGPAADHTFPVKEALRTGVLHRCLSEPLDPLVVDGVVREALRHAELEERLHRSEQDLARRAADRAQATLEDEALHDLAGAATSIAGIADSLHDLTEADAPPAEKLSTLGPIVRDLRAALGYAGNVHASLEREGPKPRPVNLHEALTEALAAAPKSAAVDVTFEVSCPPDLTAFVDPGDLQRVLLNLVANAIQALHHGGRGKGHVRLSARPTVEGAVSIRVTDDGPGVGAEHAARVFEEGYTTRRSLGGAGFGLAICKRLVQSNGGSISFIETPGGGATFAIEFPGGEFG